MHIAISDSVSTQHMHMVKKKFKKMLLTVQ